MNNSTAVLPDDLEGEFLEGENSDGPLSDIENFPLIYKKIRNLYIIEFIYITP